MEGADVVDCTDTSKTELQRAKFVLETARK
jgi:hypothetical protein